jgi:hypothetical protein
VASRADCRATRRPARRLSCSPRRSSRACVCHCARQLGREACRPSRDRHGQATRNVSFWPDSDHRRRQLSRRCQGHSGHSNWPWSLDQTRRGSLVRRSPAVRHRAAHLHRLRQARRGCSAQLAGSRALNIASIQGETGSETATPDIAPQGAGAWGARLGAGRAFVSYVSSAPAIYDTSTGWCGVATWSASVCSIDDAEACDGTGEQNCCEKGSHVSSTVGPSPAAARPAGSIWAPAQYLASARCRRPAGLQLGSEACGRDGLPVNGLAASTRASGCRQIGRAFNKQI